ncbi:undecaprenyldiphospho-muramoylpentapeptide beta-N-acetylglucosaminyltransferase [Methylacidimicrobium tartarophylax]|uniref:UDP-N-acetylglucosamine--N-acetylmuramyl-(pentapeptide) pyrophosphoryl-undecaprenol N-acetylglucosamine transferase n=1 Tax=Methylacidimicrobium tartarophylax TaxID=1041768 RepID=A0A5E6M5H7_9BACT|nr:undecaprenyldiphospho-muramoylpentapeptide beta-N-acetylglucosaminyltransferase [Methylacidimicrobium tartarophylax]VVM04589.1 UDP-N-acetylglucosamine--N-acetylmuramyl-(pentapeptide) pyrophosphoryl-undecaprenol N-acetylglucosamine transferase [Methylacidimicrobium tartarophylax]
MTKKRVVIACGGTGGHLLPGLAVAEELRRRGKEVCLLLSEKSIDRTALEGEGDYPWETLPTMGWPGAFSAKTPAFFLRLWRSGRSCAALFSRLGPGAVLGMGGFLSAAPLLVAKRRRIATVLHESNAVPGLVTRLFSHRVDRLLLGFDACRERLPGISTIVTGTPLRSSLRRVPRSEAAQALGLSADRPTILVLGGSQGAQALNRLLREGASALVQASDLVQILHLSGPADREACLAAYRSHRIPAVVESFSHRMDLFYSLADIAVARAGAATLSEVAFYGLPSILVPFPFAADDHQRANAKAFVAAGASLTYDQATLTGERLATKLREILNDDQRRREMGRSAARLARPEAARAVAEEVERCMHG